MISRIESVMLQTLLQPLVICLQLFAVYVVIHGHYSPGGGFQGGVLLGSSVILPILVKGIGQTESLAVMAKRALRYSAVGVLIFAIVGMIPFLLGAGVLDYAALPLPTDDMANRRSLGILFVELGVTLAVAGAAVSIFLTLYGKVGESFE